MKKYKKNINQNIILRETEHSPLVNKEDFLTAEDFDNNNINIYEDFVSLLATNYVDAYNNATEYNNGDFVVYNNVLYISVFPTAFTDVTPSTDEDYWVDAFPTILAHLTMTFSKQSSTL